MAAMDLPTAQSRREALLDRINAYITSVDSPEVQALDFFELKERIDRYNDQFTTLESANAIVTGATVVAADRQALWNEMHATEDRFIGAQVAMRRLFIAATPAVTVLPTDAAASGTSSSGAAATPQSITVQKKFALF